MTKEHLPVTSSLVRYVGRYSADTCNVEWAVRTAHSLVVPGGSQTRLGREARPGGRAGWRLEGLIMDQPRLGQVVIGDWYLLSGW